MRWPGLARGGTVSGRGGDAEGGAGRTIWAVAHDGAPAAGHDLGEADLDLDLPDGVAALLRLYLALEGRELELLVPVLVRKLRRHNRARVSGWGVRTEGRRDGAHAAGLELDGDLCGIRAFVEDGDGEPVVALVEFMTGEGACG